MRLYELCRQYQRAIDAKDLSGVLALFTEDALITTPLSGQLPPLEYHRRLFAIARQSISRVLNVYEGTKGNPSLALYLQHTLVLTNGKTIEIRAMNVYDATPGEDRFTSMNILFDGAAVSRRLTPEQLDCIGV
ncbi:hypothetical protein SAMN06265795_103132 [Noviherbaspirillum humi]|uniref:SnoaL-like domain-containing protein n=1 Tax=Noviherbaspirillum humi TaxID=1688639 RepID=A0A239F2S0_9BURK|nr:nuclear transport factor 2 family protein [Noviherbaspirillum humi]SNS50838.1 hypothetical protein SAMN06265795_103132 [Noviherbaspirillum humi]